MIKRTEYLRQIEQSLQRNRAVAVLGPRQSGKTTLARQLVDSKSINYFDLEDAESLARLSNPQMALAGLKGLVVIDEVQRRPELFVVLRVLLDRKPLPAKFLILGSASPELLRQSSESLAGRIETIEIDGFDLTEINKKDQQKLWVRGGFPLSFLAETDANSFAWRRSFIKTFLERDLRDQGIALPPVALRRFWTMLAHSHGQIWNASPLATSLGISQPTVRKYLDILTGVFMVRQIQPWFANIKKRQVKSPKVFIRDSGILHALLGIEKEEDILSHPNCGSSWEGHVIEQICRHHGSDEVYYWATHQGAELDLIILKGGKKYGIEIKRSEAPVLTPSMRVALEDLKLERITVIYPGEKQYFLHSKIDVVPVTSLAKGVDHVFNHQTY